MTVRRQCALLGALAVALVLLRSVPATAYEGFYFDSDQAIVGLMARHLSRFHTFPLFYYSLNYILGVQAWIIAPFFWLGRPSVGLARAPLVALNVVVALWLLWRFTRLRLRPSTAFVAALPFVVPAAYVSTQLLETAGASIEPLVYVLALWEFRRRPLAFGVLLAVAFLHREFTVFAVPAIVLVEWRTREFWSRANVRRALWAAAGFALVWLVVDDLKLRIQGGGLIGQAASLKGQMCAAGLGSRVEALTLEALPVLYGGHRLPMAAFRMASPLDVGNDVMWLIVAATLVLMLVRIVMIRPERAAGRASLDDHGFGGYLALVGLFTACVYPLSCNVTLHAPPLLRYLLLALLMPVGLFAVFMQREKSGTLRAIAAGVFVVWGALNLLDNVRVVREAVRNPPGSEHRELVEYLYARQIRYARAIYWDAYVIDFLSNERVIAASVDTIRIPEYQTLVDEHAGSAVTLERMPCAGERRVASWCVNGP